METRRKNFHYFHNIQNIPAEHHELFKALNAAIELAFEKHDKGIRQLTKSPIRGDYLFFNGEDLIEINSWTDEDTGERGYMVKEANNQWYWDPVPTLKEVRKTLELD
jgi:hypothetical protein